MHRDASGVNHWQNVSVIKSVKLTLSLKFVSN